MRLRVVPEPRFCCNFWSRSAQIRPLEKLMEKNGGRAGLAHIAFRVQDIQKAYDAMKGDRFPRIDGAARHGSGGTTVFLVHPKSRNTAFAILIDVVQDPAFRS